MFEDEPDGATPLDPDEAEGLIPDHIRTRGELNEWEQANVLAGAEWAVSTRKDALDEVTIRELHRRMFDRTWNWAGTYRTSDKNIGVYWVTVGVAVHQVVENGRFWMERGTYPSDEAALRLHHRMVQVHPFPNGNGRHARMWCDLLLRQLGRPPFEWRSRDLDRSTEARTAYIRSLRAADGGDYDPLFELYLAGR